MSATIVKGSATAIPAELLNRKPRAAREHYEFDKLDIGDHAVFTDTATFTKVRSAATAFARGNKKRAPRNIVPQTVEAKDGTKTLEVWRLPDATPAATPATANKQK